jgi:hypothetical protein
MLIAVPSLRGPLAVDAPSIASSHHCAAHGANGEQQTSITKALESFRGKNIRLESYGLDAEAAILGRQIRDAVQKANIGYTDALMTRAGSGSISLGVHVTGKDDALVRGLVAALSGAGLLTIEGDDSSRSGFITLGTVQPLGPPPDAEVFIGVKPIRG